MSVGDTALLEPPLTLKDDASVSATLAVPPCPQGFVGRPRLVGPLTEAAEAALALIVAPPGYGKSCLLSEWAEREDRDFLWLKVGTDAERSPHSTARSAARLVRNAEASARSFVLVLDDAHRLSSELLGQLVEAVLTELPRGSTLAVASRTDPRLSVGRLRANRSLVEVGMPDLAMTSAEGQALLSSAGAELDRETVRSLVDRTEGWPAALYLAATSARKQPDPFDGLAHFSGNDHLLAEYVRDEILSALPPDLIGFVLRSSLLDELSGPICDATLGEEKSALILRALARACPFLISLDPEHDRFRWHRLFREALEGELHRIDLQSPARVHQRASVWYAETHDSERAIDHAVDAHDLRRTGDLLWPELPTYLGNGGCDAVRDWLAAFTQSEIASCLPLALSAAHSCLFRGDVPGARYWALVAHDRLEDDPGGGATGTEAGLAVIESALAQSGATEMGRAAARAQELEPRSSPWRPFLCLLRGISHHLVGDLAGAESMLAQGVDRGTIPAPAVAALCLAQRAMIALESKEWDAAAEFAEQALRGCGDAQPVHALVCAALAAAWAHQGRADEAKQQLRSARDLLASFGDFLPWYGAEVRILLAYASLWVADSVGARTLLAEASRLARRVSGATMFQSWFDEAWGYLDNVAEARLSGPSSLTIAELRILRFLPTHHSFRDIGTQLGVSRNTVKTQAHAIYRKFGVASRSEAVATAIEAGLLGQ